MAATAMKVLLINGSPHANGCTQRALREVEKALNGEGIETENIHIGALDIRGCISCKSCVSLFCHFSTDCFTVRALTKQ